MRFTFGSVGGAGAALVSLAACSTGGSQVSPAAGQGTQSHARAAAGALGALGALWIACVCGGAVAAAGLATGRVRRGARMPLGPFLALGICAALVLGAA